MLQHLKIKSWTQDLQLRAKGGCRRGTPRGGGGSIEEGDVGGGLRTNQKRVSVCFVVRRAVFVLCACAVCVSVCVCGVCVYVCVVPALCSLRRRRRKTICQMKTRRKYLARFVRVSRAFIYSVAQKCKQQFLQFNTKHGKGMSKA